MIHHYVNLVTIRPLLTLYDNGKIDPTLVTIHVDSMSLLLYLRLLGITRKRNSGIEYALWLKSEILSNKILQKDIYYILPHSKMLENVPHGVVAPILDKTNMDEFVNEIRGQIFTYKIVILGVGGPSHDALGFKLSREFPEKDILCLGAALDVLLLKKNSNTIKLINRLGLNFVYFLIKDPRRFIAKISITIYELVKTHRFVSKSAIGRFFNDK